MLSIHRTLVLACCSLILLQASAYAQQETRAKAHAPGEDIYRHYKGTIGGKHVVLDLRYGFQGASNYGTSSWYYTETEGLNSLILTQPASFDHDATITCEHYPASVMWGPDPLDREKTPGKWTISMKSGKLTGKWNSTDGKQSKSIDLTEDYKDAVAMEVMCMDTATYTDNKVFFVGVKPAAGVARKEADFISSALTRWACGDTISADSWQHYPKAAAEKFLGRFHKDLAPSSRNGGSPMMKNNQRFIMVFPVYNEQGMLVIGQDISDFHNNGSTVNCPAYLCLDVKQQKIWKLSDVVDTGNNKLTAAVRKATQTLYHQEAGKKSGYLFDFEQIKPTENFILCNKGLMFCYKNPDESFWTSEIRIFVPYAQLKDILKKDFKKRMKL
jgi:hypothetical protein